MITLLKLNEYKKYHGSYDGFYIQKIKTNTNLNSDSDWNLIENLLQDIVIIQNQLASEDFTKNVNKRLLENCDNLDIIEQMKVLAEISKIW